jgi:hypothetical protein
VVVRGKQSIPIAVLPSRSETVVRRPVMPPLPSAAMAKVTRAQLLEQHKIDHSRIQQLESEVRKLREQLRASRDVQ